MLSFNHPRAFVLDTYLTNIFKYAGLKTRTYDTFLLNDPLLEAAILPIYSYVTQSNSLPYSYNNSLKQPERLGGRYLEFNEFIEESYTLYDNQIN